MFVLRNRNNSRIFIIIVLSVVKKFIKEVRNVWQKKAVFEAVF